MDSMMKAVKRVSRCFTLYRGRCLEAEGINGYQHSYLLRICEQPGLTQDELAQAIYVNKSNVTRQLALLEQEGFVTRQPGETDRRQMAVYPTDKARALYPRVRQVAMDWEAALLEGMGEEERAALAVSLEKMAARAAELAAPRQTMKGDGRPE